MRATVLLLLFVFLAASSDAETIELKSGKTIEAEILKKTEDYIKINFQGIPLTFYSDEIESIFLDIEEKSLNTVEEKASSDTDTLTPDDNIPAITNKIIENISDHVIEKASQSVVVVMAERVNKPSLYGTGFFISNDGLIATNFHVVFNADNIHIKTKKGTTYPVKRIVYYDDKTDFCILKADMKSTPGLPVGDSDKLFAGQKIFTIGHPQGYEYEITKGQYLNRRLFDGTELLMTILDTDIGNSGAPIMDEDGKVIGISTLSSKNVEGYNFGIPINAVKEFFDYSQGFLVKDLKRRINKSYELTYAGKGSLLEGKNEEAVNYFKQALDADPDYLEAFIGLGRAYNLLNMKDEAFNAWQDVQKRDPQNASACAFLGKSYLNKNMFDEAIVNLEKAVSLDSQSVHIYNDLGFAYGKKGMSGKAVEAYQKTIEMDPDYADGYFNLAVSCYEKRDMQRAKEYCEKAVDLGYNVPEQLLSVLGLKR